MSVVDQFSLFKQLSNQLVEDNIEEIQSKNDGDCIHKTIVSLHSSKTCLDCGQEINSEIIYDKEWKYYNINDNKLGNDTTRCQMRKTNVKSIYNDIKDMGFNERIMETANDIYISVTKGKIYRGNSRKALIFACVFNAYKIHKNPRSCEDLVKIFGLERRIGLKGLKLIHLNMPQDSDTRNIRITTKHIIAEMMKKFKTTDENILEVQDIFDEVKNRSSIINRSRPTSVAAGIIYYYILKTNNRITLKEFSVEVLLSQLTIKKIIKEIETILGPVQKKY